MKRLVSLLFLVFLISCNCSCSLREPFSIEHVPVYGDGEVVWYTPFQSYPRTYASEIIARESSGRVQYGLSWNGQDLQGSLDYKERIYPAGMFERLHPTEYSYYETFDAKFARPNTQSTYFWYQADEDKHSVGKEINAQARIALLEQAKNEYNDQIPEHLKEYFVAHVDPQGLSMSYTLQIPQVPQLNDFGLHISLFPDGSLRSLRKDDLIALGETTVEQLIQEAQALSGQEVITALEQRMDLLYTLGEDSIFLFSLEDSPHRATQRNDHLDYESGRWTDYQVISDDVWFLAPNSKLCRQFDCQITTTLLSQENIPLTSSHAATFYVTA